MHSQQYLLVPLKKIINRISDDYDIIVLLMIISYGIVRNLFYYRTPITLRAYSKIFIYFFPILYAPYCASTFNDYSHGIAYVIAVLYSVILVSLDNLQEHLENPFDQIGEDDINFEVDEMDLLMVEPKKD